MWSWGARVAHQEVCFLPACHLAQFWENPRPRAALGNVGPRLPTVCSSRCLPLARGQSVRDFSSGPVARLGLQFDRSWFLLGHSCWQPFLVHMTLRTKRQVCPVLLATQAGC